MVGHSSLPYCVNCRLLKCCHHADHPESVQLHSSSRCKSAAIKQFLFLLSSIARSLHECGDTIANRLFNPLLPPE